MKLFFVLFLLFPSLLSAQVLIHSHNDYHKAEPLTNALRNKVYSIEADVYLVNDTLRVAHDRKELTASPTLTSLYLQPLVEFFKSNHGRVSSDTGYSPILMIDIKDRGKDVLNKLKIDLAKHPEVFDRSKNPKAVQVVISGDRGPVAEWKTHPSFIMFDGRPNEVYDSITLRRVALISDSYLTYGLQGGNVNEAIRLLARKVHILKKLFRLWAIPDDPSSWKNLKGLGVDIINTDKVDECRKTFGN